MIKPIVLIPRFANACTIQGAKKLLAFSIIKLKNTPTTTSPITNRPNSAGVNHESIIAIW